MPKRKIKDRDVILRAILNKMLEKHNIDFDYVLKHQEIDGKDWFDYYTMTQAEYETWKEWSMQYLKGTNLPESTHENEFAMVNLMWGLKIQEDETNNTE